MRRILTTLLLAATLTACGSDDGSGLDWSASDEPVGTAAGGLAWADAKTGEIHLPDGSTLTAERPISSFVVAGKGAYVVDKSNQSLVEVTADGARGTDAHVDERMRASPDGRYLAFIDPKAGQKSKGDVAQLVSVVVDLKTGKEVLRSTRGMGDPDTDDLTDLYEDASYGVLGVTDKTAWIEPAIGDVLAIDLSSGKVTTAPDADLGNADNPWVQPTIPPEPVGGDWNADKSWAIKHVSTRVPSVDPDPASRLARDVLVSADDAELVPRPGTVSWSFDRWLDQKTVVGFADQNLEDPDSPGQLLPSSLITCTVPDGDCTTVPDTDDAILPEPNLY